MDQQKRKTIRRTRRKNHVRRKIVGTAERPRLTVFRSSKNISAQLIDDLKGITLAAASSLEPGIRQALAYGGNIKAARTSSPLSFIHAVSCLIWLMNSGEILTRRLLAFSPWLNTITPLPCIRCRMVGVP